MDLCTNAGIVSDAMKFVNQQIEQIDILHKLGEKIEVVDEGTATNGIF